MSNNKEFTLKKTIRLPFIQSAGGLVINQDNCILLMFKRGKWDLPKGRIEKGQEKEVAAIREVQEEVGLSIDKLSIIGKLVPTWHTTTHNHKEYLKKTTWFLMAYKGNEKPKPQIEEGIIECRWIHMSELPEYRELIKSRVNYVIHFWHNNLAYAPRQ